MTSDSVDPVSMHIRTPLLKSYPLTSRNDKPIWLKMDAMQPCGSFKLRGMGYKARKEAGRGAKRFVSSSGGNAGLAVAYAGLALSIPVSVYVPTTTGSETVDRLRLYDANVVVTGSHWADAHAEAVKQLHDESAAYFHPFDDADVWEGHASLIDEVVEEGVRPDLVLCSVGGGGLLCGIMAGLARNGLDATRVLAVETIGADSMNQSRVEGAHISLDRITSAAKSLGATKICDKAYEYLSDPGLVNCVVTDDDARNACDGFLHDHRVKVELACGAALSPVYGVRHDAISSAKCVLVVVCGGVSD